jgi:hypothetical protein
LPDLSLPAAETTRASCSAAVAVRSSDGTATAEAVMAKAAKDEAPAKMLAWAAEGSAATA